MTSLIGPTIPAEYAAAMARTSDDTTAGSGVTAPAQQEQEQLSHEERYHSIKAKGEDREAIIQAALDEEMEIAPKPTVMEAPVPEEQLEELKAQAIDTGVKSLEDDHYSPPEQIDADEEMKEPENPNIEIPEVPDFSSQQAQPQPQLVQPPAMPSMPEALVQASVGDESLRNLMMAWYWAGYYTGLQEGRMQVQTPGRNTSAS
ncbi:hypothetical protein EX30DRAFT_57968 [Ascodesmis nigricans]|uniref:Uncharacterized protein n=1 Tax=Ascodesmis nigricans TaxID=341454 RepID=A0A4S2MV26_9PEZI|nr:hypothetical protein EX30DRAFT_57968 [Ascodesmis nigricans]